MASQNRKPGAYGTRNYIPTFSFFTTSPGAPPSINSARSRGTGGGSGSNVSNILTGASALGSLGYSAELGVVTVNPYLAIPAAVDLIVNELIGAFQGKPKLLDSAQAVKRLAQSSNPAVQSLASDLGIYLKNGVPLSTSNPAQQAQLRDWIAGTIQTIGQQLHTTLNPSQVTQLDQSIHNVLESEVANPGTSIDNTIAQIAGQVRSPSTAVIASQQPVVVQPMRTNTRVLNRQPSVLPSPNAVSALRTLLESKSEIGEGLVLSRTQDLTPENLATTAGQLAYEYNPASLGTQLGTYLGNKINSYLHPQENTNQVENVGNTPQQPAPILDQTSDCPGCSKVSKQIRAQQQQLQQEITTETEQEVEQQLSQTEQQLTQFSNLEQQPASQRNIPQELQQKQQLSTQLQQFQNEIQNLPTLNTQPSTTPAQTTSPQGGQPAPALTPNTTEQLQQDQQAAQHFSHQVQEESPSPEISFCVGCQSQEDAILFLNGEPSKCSVIPGSTKTINTTQ